MDFTTRTYQALLEAQQAKGYEHLSFKAYLEGGKSHKYIILRHDVEKSYHNALRLAKVEHSLNIKGTYFFRITTSFDKVILRKIANLELEVSCYYVKTYQNAMIPPHSHPNTMQHQ